MQNVHQRDDIFLLLVTTMHGNDVGIRVIFTTLYRNRVMYRIKARINRVVGVNHDRVTFVVVVHLWQQRGFHVRRKLQFFRVFHDIADTRGHFVDARLQFDHPLFFEDRENTALFRYSITHDDFAALRQIFQGFVFFGIDPDWLDVDRARADKIIILITGVIFQHAVQVRNMLEIVSVNIMTRQRGVGQNVVLERFDLQIDTLLRQDRLRLLQNFGVRRVGCPHGQGISPGGKAQGAQGCCGDQCQCFFHDDGSCVLLEIIVYLTVRSGRRRRTG
ncbi:hypothetical protein EcWSU1_01874 [Enterobacter ludwigii]|uniref:Uncharacterized protein n=1 Tax=Enterobacter ludwigii TaxID=299767 RepID=G8LLF6_9ENTR|nr:hypothetical protein EcWSU1_01874 [Enterobacter ludwigii]